MVRCSVAVTIAALLLVAACDKESNPVSVPMGDIPLPPEPAASSSAADATDTATSTAQARGTGNYTGARSTASKAADAPIDSCCSALLDKANKSTDKATKQLYDQAASICYRRAKQVREGKMSRAEALAQVRSSLLGPAPASCH